VTSTSLLITQPVRLLGGGTSVLDTVTSLLLTLGSRAGILSLLGRVGTRSLAILLDLLTLLSGLLTLLSGLLTLLSGLLTLLSGLLTLLSGLLAGLLTLLSGLLSSLTLLGGRLSILDLLALLGSLSLHGTYEALASCPDVWVLYTYQPVADPAGE